MQGIFFPQQAENPVYFLPMERPKVREQVFEDGDGGNPLSTIWNVSCNSGSNNSQGVRDEYRFSLKFIKGNWQTNPTHEAKDVIRNRQLVRRFAKNKAKSKNPKIR